MNCTQNLQKNAEMSNFDDFWAICVRKLLFQDFSKFPLFGPLFPLFSRCFPAVRAQFPLFSPCFLAVFSTFWLLQGFAVKMSKKTKFCPERVKTAQKHRFWDFVRRTVVLQSKRTKKLKFQKSCPKQWFAVKARKTNKHLGIHAPNCPKHTFCLRIAISMVFLGQIKVSARF